MKAPLYIVTDWIAYEGSTVSAVLTDEADALAIVAFEAKAKRPRQSGRDVACWRWTGERYEEDTTWPRRATLTP